MDPRRSFTNVRYQLRDLMLHERTKTRPPTTTTQMRMNPWVMPALIRRLFASRKTATVSAAKRRGRVIGRVRPGSRLTIALKLRRLKRPEINGPESRRQLEGLVIRRRRISSVQQ